MAGIRITRPSAATADDASASVLRQLLPHSAWEWRALAAVAAVRFVLLPGACVGLVLGAVRAGLLPQDPACAFMLLLQSCMPPGAREWEGLRMCLVVPGRRSGECDVPRVCADVCCCGAACPPPSPAASAHTHMPTWQPTTMPTAQNLVLMMQLQPGTAALAPATARLLLQLYTLAVVPVTLWVSVFARLVGL